MAQNIVINTAGLGITWGLGNTYRVAIDDGFIFSESGLRLPISGNTNILSFTTPSLPPLLSSTVPANNTTAQENIQNISISLNRKSISALTGNINLFRATGNTLVRTISIGNATITGNTIFANIIGSLEASTNYYVTTTANIVQDSDSNKFAGISTGNIFAFTSPAAPSLVSTYPTNGATDVEENTTISFTLNRNIYKNSGNIFLYKISSPNLLVKSYNVSSDSNLTTSGATVSLNINGLLANSSSYYVYTDANVVMDITQIKFPGITSNTAFTFTTSSTFSNDFPPTISSMFYNEDTVTKIASPLLLPVPSYDTSSYTVQITSNVGIVDMTSSGSGGSFTWTYSNPGGNLIITGNRSQINSYLNDLYLEPQADFANNISLTYTITNPNSQVTTKNQIVNINQQNSETLNLATSRTYLSNTENVALFPSSPIAIDDAGAVDQEYSVTLTSASQYIKFSNNLNSISFSGIKSSVNSSLASLTITPTQGYKGNTTINYTQIRNGQSQSTGSFALNNIGNGFTETNTYTFTSSGTWTPSANQVKFGRLNILVIGAGGGGAAPTLDGFRGAGGGGAGGVVGINNLTLTQKTYNITVGAGAFGFGGFSSFDGIVAAGGQPGVSQHSSTGSAGSVVITYNSSGGASGTGTSGGAWSGSQGAGGTPPSPWVAGGGGGGGLTAGSQPRYFASSWQPGVGGSGPTNLARGGSGTGGTGLGPTFVGANGADNTGNGGDASSRINSPTRGGSGLVSISIVAPLDILDPPTVPGAPIITSDPLYINTTSANITYTAPTSNGGAAITSYTAVSNIGNITSSVSRSTGGNILVSGLSVNTNYSFVIYATNSIGNSANSNPLLISTFGVPAAPTITSIQLNNSNIATINYTLPNDSYSSTITSVTAISNIGNLNSTISTSSSGSIDVYGLLNNTTYQFYVYASNEFGNSANSAPSANVGLTVPNTPSNISANIISSNTVSVSYSPPISNYGGDILSYTATSNVGDYKGTATSGNILVTIPDLSIPYSFTVYATNAYGNSNVSAQSNGVVIPPNVSSASYPGSNFSFLSGAISSATNTGNFTLEGWFYNTDTGIPNERCIFDTRNFTGSSNGWMLRNSGSSDFLFLLGGGGSAVGFIASGRVNNTWQHLALVRSSNIMSLYVDGILKNSTDVSDWTYSSTFWRLGGFTDSSASTTVYNGYIDEVRYSNIARYTSAFTPLVTYNADSNTLLLLKMNGANNSTQFVDSSNFNQTITRGGTVNVPGGATGTGNVVITTAIYKS